MQRILTLVFVIISSSCFSQLNLSPTAWQEDLRFLQQTVNADYSFLFKKIDAETWNNKVDQFHERIPDLAEHQIIAGLTEIVSSFLYGHTRMGHNPKLGFHQLPLNLYSFNDGIYIEGIHNSYEEALGAKVISIAGMNIDEALNKIRPLVPAENDQFFTAYGINYLRNTEFLHAQKITDQLTHDIGIEVEKGGKTWTVVLKAEKDLHVPTAYGFIQSDTIWTGTRDESENPMYLDLLDKNYYYKYLADKKALYVRQSHVWDDEEQSLADFYAEVFEFVDQNEVDKLIIDVRLNGGGNNYKNKPVITGLIRADKINQPGKLMVIIGRRTFSACQNLVNEISNYTNAIFVGEPTAENINFYGDNRPVTLPNSQLEAYLSFAWWQDKPQWENDDWLAPHLFVDMSFEEYKSNQDPVLDAALAFDGTDFIMDPMAYMTELFTTGQLEKLESEAERMVSDPRYQFFDFEGKLNQAGYNLLNNKRIEEAIYVFTMNTKVAPQSANVWDSLGEAYWVAGDRDKAIENYNKAISLDPDGPIGENALKMLEKIGKSH